MTWAWLLLPLAALSLWSRRTVPLLFCLAGAAWAVFRADLILQEQLPPELEGHDVQLEGQIADLPSQGDRGPRFPFDVEHAWSRGVSVVVPSRVQLTVFDPQFVATVGDRWRFTVRLKRPHGSQNPGGHDYEAYLFRNRIRAMGYVRSDPAAIRLGEDWATYPVAYARQRLGEAIAARLPTDPFVGMVTAFANGDESGISDTQWRVLQRSGTVHLIAISGMNVSFIAGIAFWLGRRVWVRLGRAPLYWPAPKAAAVGALLVALAYAALAGFAIPTQRALVMLTVVLGGVVFQRRWAPSYVLALALLLVLVFDPLAVLSPGFWLSFASVAVITFVIQERTATTQWWQWGRVQAAIAIGLLPLMIALFQQTTLAAPLANAVAIPVIELLVIPLTLLGVACMALLPALAVFPLKLAAFVLKPLWVALTFLASFERLQWVQHQPSMWALACATVGAAWLLAPRGWPGRWVGAVWLLPMLLLRPPGPKPGELWFTLLDVGQGLSAVVRTADHVLVFDAGPRPSARLDSGRQIVVPYLRGAGVDHVDTLIVSHDHVDHTGGVGSLREALPVGRILSSVPTAVPDSDSCAYGQTWRWDGVDFAILGPFAPQVGVGNQVYCVLAVSSPYGRILLPGDIEAHGERDLLTRVSALLPATMLVAPHHGSKTSSTPLFVERVHPRFVLFPIGYRNSYHHPHADVVARYSEIGAQLRDSASAGAIEMRFTEQGIGIESFRQNHHRYWFTD